MVNLMDKDRTERHLLIRDGTPESAELDLRRRERRAVLSVGRSYPYLQPKT